MTKRRKHTRGRAAIPVFALVAAMALAGCSGTHVGESWQCPLAQGASCDSVAAADPAVPDAGAEGKPVLRTPLYEARGAGPSGAPAAARPCDAGCGGFDPFAWLARLFGGGEADGASEKPGSSAAPVPDNTATPATESLAPVPARVPPIADGHTGASDAAAAAAPAAAAALPDPADGDLRTGEVIGRIWIAPFVDADGVYREAFHVRAVLEPAGWRLP